MKLFKRPGPTHFSMHLLISLALLVVTFLVVTAAMAAENSSPAIDWLEMTKGLFGGLALFLFGMEQMSRSFDWR